MRRVFHYCAFLLGIGAATGHVSHAATTRLAVTPVCDVKPVEKSGSGESITILGRIISHAHGIYLDDPDCENLVPLQFPESRSKDSGLDQLSRRNLFTNPKLTKGWVYCICTGKLVATSGSDYLLLEKVQSVFASERPLLPPKSGR
jgi:hypothetical protein